MKNRKDFEKIFKKVLFLGDVVGKPGRRAVGQFLDKNAEKYDFVVVNCENAAHGIGLTEKNYNELIGYGVDCLTSGNHIFQRNNSEVLLKKDKLVCPFNHPFTPSNGYKIFEVKNKKIAVINLLGKVFMQPADCPFKSLEKIMKKIKKEIKKADFSLLDFHAEATAEKLSMGYFANNLGIDAVIGTHTHVQTNDNKVLNNKTLYITDVGFCGASESIIGMNVEDSIKHTIGEENVRFDIPPVGRVQINAVELDIEKKIINKINEEFEVIK